MKNLLFIIFIAISPALVAQTNKDICHNMGKVKVVFTSTMTKDSLFQVQKYLAKKGIELTYRKYSFNKLGELRYLSFEVKCLGCNTGGSAVLKRDSFKEGVLPWGIYYFHGHKPSFMIGEVSDL
ncbi:MAG: hypothetical protein L3J74_16880 [Bacteroidales bacterium]|nr:hypothetical protein [Bacteroidales bacterium]